MKCKFFCAGRSVLCISTRTICLFWDFMPCVLFCQLAVLQTKSLVPRFLAGSGKSVQQQQADRHNSEVKAAIAV